MEKVTIDYNRLCLELEKQGKTKADLSRDMTKNKNFVGLMDRNAMNRYTPLQHRRGISDW